MIRALKSAAALALAAALGWASPAGAQDRPEVNILTYSSFSGKYGPGPKLKAGFEARCGCTLNFISADDAGAMVARLKLEGASSRADALVGIDLNLMGEAKASGLFTPHGLDVTGLDLPAAFVDETFVPFDYGWFAFVYDSTKLENPPASLAALIEAPASMKIVIQDPRSSTPGLGLLLWMKAVYGDKAGEQWTKLHPKIVTVTKGWSEAYGLFLKGEADMVLSYTTSPAYHLIAEKKDQYKAAIFPEGHVLQVEIAGLLKNAKQPKLARDFLAYLTSAEGQALIPETQWMYPVRGAVPAGFETLEKPAKSLVPNSAEVAAKRRAWIDEWLAATTR